LTYPSFLSLFAVFPGLKSPGKPKEIYINPPIRKILYCINRLKQINHSINIFTIVLGYLTTALAIANGDAFNANIL